MSIHGLLVFALVYFVFVVTPGPGIGAIVARGLGMGLRHAVPFLAGFVLGDMTWFTLAASGLAALANHYALGFVVLKYVGCAYLVYLAYKMWTTPPATSEVTARDDGASAFSTFAGSLTLTWSNPKVIVFFLSIMPVVVDVRDMSLGIYAAMACTMALVCGGVVSGYLLLAHQARKVFTSSKSLLRINRGAAALMAGAAAMIATKG